MAIEPIVCMARLPGPAGARNATRPPALVRADTSRSAAPLLRITT